MSLYVKIKKRLGQFILDVEFTSEKGVAGLLGASGCGKTLTLRSISGIMTPDEGRIVLNGVTLFDSEKHINLSPQQRRVGYLFQNYALFPNMTVEQNIACGLHHEKNRKLRGKAVAEMIEKMRLSGLELRQPSKLSGGQQQRTALARILVGRPEILLLDEPFSALDSYLRDQLLTELRNTLQTFDGDTLMVTHSRDEAYKLCNTLAIMDNGRLVRWGDTKEIFTDPATRTAAVLTGCKNIVDAKKVGDTMVYVPEWGETFDAGQTVNDNFCAVGVRAHCFSEEIKENAFSVRVVEQIEEPFEWTIKFLYQGQREDSEPIWWRIAKGDKREDIPNYIGIASKDLLLLYR
jgi:molybdate transport system ATP-binding protein